MRLHRAVILLLLAAPPGCQRPPASAYVAVRTAGSVSVGANTAGEACTQDAGAGERNAAILCANRDQPSAQVLGGDAATPGSLPALVITSPWRIGLDRRVACADPAVETTVLGAPALLLQCHLREGGWPYLAVATIIDGRAWFADGIAPTLPAMERSIGVLTGRLTGAAIAAHQISPGLAAQRVATTAYSDVDLSKYERDMKAADEANLAGNYAEAERAYAAVAALQRRFLRNDDPALAATLASEAVQDSNLGHYGNAARLLADASRLADPQHQPDANLTALVERDKGLNLLNQHKPADALAALARSKDEYEQTLPNEDLIPQEATGSAPQSSLGRTLEAEDRLHDDRQRTALIGIIETERAEAVALKAQHKLKESAAAADFALRIAEANRLEQPNMNARLLRTSAFVEEAEGHGDLALSQLGEAQTEFRLAFPGTLAYGTTTLLFAARQADSGRKPAALASCRQGIAALRIANVGIRPALLAPCLSLMQDAAQGADTAALHAEMFEAAELGQGSVTSQQIAEASARLSEGAGDPRVREALQRKAMLTAQLDSALAATGRFSAPAANAQASAEDAARDKQVAALRDQLRNAGQAVEAAAPNYDALIQTVVSAKAVMAKLRPGEAFCSIMLAPDAGWSFLLRDGAVSVASIPGGTKAMGVLVSRIRESLDSVDRQTQLPRPFDTAAAAAAYQALFGSFGPQLQGATELTVAPSGPLLSLPFGLLLTGPARQDALAEAPWLVQRFVISHVPAPANFVTLRENAGTSRATRPWFGFGDVRPVTRAQAEASFPPASCGSTAARLAAIPPLPGATKELQAVRMLTHAGPTDELLGANFTTATVFETDLTQARILHFATHALLATDLSCQTEPALLVSVPAGAPGADAALLTSSAVMNHLKLDADTVILSACNTGGGDGDAAGEGLSGLARSFFFAGARSLLVTHWGVNDAAAAHLVELTIAKTQDDPALGMAGALAAAERQMLAESTGELAVFAHPFYWAPIALIGDGEPQSAGKLLRADLPHAAL